MATLVGRLAPREVRPTTTHHGLPTLGVVAPKTLAGRALWRDGRPDIGDGIFYSCCWVSIWSRCWVSMIWAVKKLILAFPFRLVGIELVMYELAVSSCCSMKSSGVAFKVFYAEEQSIF